MLLTLYIEFSTLNGIGIAKQREIIITKGMQSEEIKFVEYDCPSCIFNQY